jgi:hypothetical protein
MGARHVHGHLTRMRSSEITNGGRGRICSKLEISLPISARLMSVELSTKNLFVVLYYSTPSVLKHCQAISADYRT